MFTQRKVPKRKRARRLVRYANALDSRFYWRSPKLASLRSLKQGFASPNKSCESRRRLTGIKKLEDTGNGRKHPVFESKD